MILNGAFKTNNDAKIRNREERGPTHDALKLEGQSNVFESVVKTEINEHFFSEKREACDCSLICLFS